jgi:branched-chain amino acid transport system ATP-binding protein
MSVILSTDNLTKKFGAFTALKNVSFKLEKGARHALIGPNGAGKSTLISCLCGQSQGVEGKVIYDGKDISGLPPYEIFKHGIGRTFQVSRTYLKMNAFENMVAAILVSKGIWRSILPKAFFDVKDEAWQALETVGLQKDAEKIVGEMSLSDRKRLEFGMTLASDSEVLMLDEPTAGMSLEERYFLMDMVTELVQKKQKSLLFVEHDIDVVLKIAQKVTVMVRGEVFVEGTPSEIAQNEDVQNVYLGEGEGHA